MFDASRDTKTICALASASGTAAISIIRLSGPDSYRIIQTACKGLAKKKLESHRAYLAKIFDSKNEVIDQVVVTAFDHRKSYTGEETIEISSHGSPHITKKILEALVEFGAVIAEKGEYTYRAFLNDRLDLVQAEAVLSVIESQSDSALKMSLRQLEGKISKKFENLEDRLTWCLAHIEASIDFSTEGLDVVDPQVLIQELKGLKVELKSVTDSYSQGKILKDGIKLVLAGLPNVGKSSLLNNLVLDEKAIVTDIAGTTRDVVEGATFYNSVKFNISDTAGLRETTDVVENIGVQKTLKEIESGDITLFAFDSSIGLQPADLERLRSVKGNVLVLANKSDKSGSEAPLEIKQKLQDLSGGPRVIDVLPVSALDVGARDTILHRVSTFMGSENFSDESVISSARQFELSQAALNLIEQSIVELESQMGSEFVAQTLKTALMSVQKILGTVFDDQIMDRVFKEFCLGK